MKQCCFVIGCCLGATIQKGHPRNKAQSIFFFGVVVARRECGCASSYAMGGEVECQAANLMDDATMCRGQLTGGFEASKRCGAKRHGSCLRQQGPVIGESATNHAALPRCPTFHLPIHEPNHYFS
jgi:hypothetical protein